MPGQQIITFTHQPDEDVQEMDAVKYDRIVFDILVEGLPEIYRVLSPVHVLLLVVRNMIPVVPAFMVVRGVDTGNAVLERIAWVIAADE